MVPVIELLTAVAVYYVMGCLAFAFSDLYKLESVPFCKWVEKAPNWLVTFLVTLLWPYVVIKLIGTKNAN